MAGSERLSISSDTEETEKETKFINKSLFYLTKVIQLLSLGNPYPPAYLSHIPFRDSKLTRILSDALGGNCLTVLIANISPLLQDSVQTISTLKFASRAKIVRTQPKRVEILAEDNEEMVRLTHVIDSQTAQIKEVVSAEVERLPNRPASASAPITQTHSGRAKGRARRNQGPSGS